MNKKILIIIIAVLAVIALGLGIAILVMPEPEKPVEIIHYDNNRLIETLGITRPDKRVERLLAIKTYEGNPNFNDMLKLALAGKLEYYELDPKSDNYMLIVPMNINGKMRLYDVQYSDYDEEYQLKTENPVLKCYNGERLPQNYALLVRYTRPSSPKFAVKLFLRQDATTGVYQTATYMITNNENGEPVKTIQFVKDDIEPGTQSFGSELEIINENDNVDSNENNEENEENGDTQENGNEDSENIE